MFEIISGSIHLSEEIRRAPTEPSLNGETFARSEAKRPRVLVVDDEKLIVDTLAEILQNAGFHVAAAYDGWTALEAARLFHPDYLLSDVLMPKMNGVELAIAIQKYIRPQKSSSSQGRPESQTYCRVAISADCNSN